MEFVPVKIESRQCAMFENYSAANPISSRQGNDRKQSRLRGEPARSVRGAEKDSPSHFFHTFTCGLRHARCVPNQSRVASHTSKAY